MKTIQIKVSPQGIATVETKGFTGNQCKQASQFLTQALGPIGHEQLKPEFHQEVDHRGNIETNQ